MDIDDFLKDKAGFYSVESGFAVWEVKNSEFLHNIEMPDAHIQVFIIRGTINAVIDDNNVILRSDSLTDILQCKMQLKDASEDISVVFIMISEMFLTGLIKNKPPFPIEYVMRVIEQPVLILSHSQSVIIKERIELLINIFKDTSNFYQTEMLKNALWMVYLEMSNIFMHQNDDMNIDDDGDRKHMLFIKFAKMLPKYVKQAHTVGFYASKLCVSCQYLERVTKLISGQTAYQWIQRALVGEINHELKFTDKSIQQIADEFGFPDQATFTKYYKRNTHMPPSKFRTDKA